MIALAALALAAWVVLALTGFWLCDQTDDRVAIAAGDQTDDRTSAALPANLPAVTAIVPARDEADVIARAIASLLAQDYSGAFRIVLVDDNSADGTAAIAAALPDPHGRLTVLSGAPLAAGWTGKLWALSQGIAAAGPANLLWLTDADIAHAPDTLARLVAIARAPGRERKLVSFMARLNTANAAERALVPAFVWFFMMLYPFGWINRGWFAGDPKWLRRVAGAAGGCVLVEAATLAQAGGVAAMRGALIDDCTLGALIKRHGAIWLGLTRRSVSIRPYGGTGTGAGAARRGLAEIGAMIARSAYAQLRFNPLLLAATLAGLALLFVAPPALALAAHGPARALAWATLALMAALYQPILAFYRQSPLWALIVPLVGLFYAGCTLASAVAYWRGRGGMWKGRAQAPAGAR